MYYIIMNPASQSGQDHNAVARRLEEALKEHNIPYKIYCTRSAEDPEAIAARITGDPGLHKEEAAGMDADVETDLETIETDISPGKNIRSGTGKRKNTDTCKDIDSRENAGRGPEEEATIVVIGGDGTINGVINGIRDFAKVKFGFIPAGSANDLAEGLGVKDIIRDESQEENIRRIVDGTVRRTIDLGQICCKLSGENESKTRLFAVSAGIGFDAGVCHESDVSKIRKFFNTLHVGKLSYGAIALQQLITTPEVGCDITICRSDSMEKKPQEEKIMTRDALVRETVEDKRKACDQTDQSGVYPCSGSAWQELKGADKTGGCEMAQLHIKKLVFATFMNTPYEGGGYKFAPDAVCDDGLINVSAIGDLSKLTVLVHFPAAHRGNYYHVRGVYHAKAPEMYIRTEEPLWVHTDGEVLGKVTDFSIRCLPHTLKMIV